MTAMPRRIGVMTGGGDCPGLNAVIRAVTKDALYHGIEVVGVEDGFEGLIEDRMRVLSYEDVSNILTIGGTILGTSNRADPRRHPVGTEADGAVVRGDVGVLQEHLNALRDARPERAALYLELVAALADVAGRRDDAERSRAVRTWLESVDR